MIGFLRKAALATSFLSVMTANMAPVFANTRLAEAKVFANHGRGFEFSGMAAPGDQIFVGQKSSVKIIFANGCKIQLDAKQIYVVPAKPPCLAKVKSSQGIYGAPSALPAPPAAIPVAPALNATSGLAIGGVAVAAAAAAAALLLLKPASPP